MCSSGNGLVACWVREPMHKPSSASQSLHTGSCPEAFARARSHLCTCSFNCSKSWKYLHSQKTLAPGGLWQCTYALHCTRWWQTLIGRTASMIRTAGTQGGPGLH